jgi:anti-anti-sigma factor
MEFRDSDVRNAYNEAYRLLSQPGARHLLVDFSRLEYFGSTFVGILIRLARKVRQCGGETVLCSLSGTMQEMLRTLMLLENTKTDFVMKPFADTPQAIAYLQSLPPVS